MPDNIDEVLNKFASMPFLWKDEILHVNSLAIDGDSILHKAVAQKDLPSVRTLILNGSNPNTQGDMGNTPLHEALYLGEFELSKALVDAGAIASILNEFGKTPMDLAIESGDARLQSLVRRSTG